MLAADPYALLGVPRGASPAAAKRAFRARAKALHPDKRPDDPRAQQRFVELQRALDEVPAGTTRELLRWASTPHFLEARVRGLSNR